MAQFMLIATGGVMSAAFGAGVCSLAGEVRRFFMPPPPPSTLEVITTAGGELLRGVVRVTQEHKALAGCSLAATILAARYREPVLRATDYIVPGFRWVKTKIGFEPPVFVETSMKKRNCFESVRAGSEQSKTVMPKSQVLVGTMDAGVFKASGCGVRIMDYLVVPAHVFATVDDIALKGKENWVNLGRDLDYIEIDTDLLVIKLPVKHWSVLGTTKASICRRLPMTGDFVSIVGASGMGTTGTLRHDSVLFGRVVYSGTTVAGYSGAGYYSASLLSGVHTNGGNVNGGYSAAYILCILNSLEKIDPEDTWEWVQRLHKQKKQVKIDRRLGGGEVRIFADGIYTTVKEQSMRQAFGDHWEEELSKERPTYIDTHYQGDGLGEARSSKSGALNTLVETPGTVDKVPPELMNLLGKMSKAQFVELRKKASEAQSTSSVPPN
ncbi:MAG: hypothetical protein [Ixodes ricinus sobemo-like virus 1]|nr:MAG: hypothetical protein [Ixodes ricinus sobemo-like virus 1]